jgi:hypothetical protein
MPSGLSSSTSSAHVYSVRATCSTASSIDARTSASGVFQSVRNSRRNGSCRELVAAIGVTSQLLLELLIGALEGDEAMRASSTSTRDRGEAHTSRETKWSALCADLSSSAHAQVSGFASRRRRDSNPIRRRRRRARAHRTPPAQRSGPAGRATSALTSPLQPTRRRRDSPRAAGATRIPSVAAGDGRARSARIPRNEVERDMGFEPTTFSLGS